VFRRVPLQVGLRWNCSALAGLSGETPAKRDELTYLVIHKFAHKRVAGPDERFLR